VVSNNLEVADAICLEASPAADPPPRKTRGGKYSVLQSLENPQNRKIVSTTRRPKDGVGVER
jgi:hypothetical protein